MSHLTSSVPRPLMPCHLINKSYDVKILMKATSKHNVLKCNELNPYDEKILMKAKSKHNVLKYCTYMQ